MDTYLLKSIKVSPLYGSRAQLGYARDIRRAFIGAVNELLEMVYVDGEYADRIMSIREECLYEINRRAHMSAIYWITMQDFMCNSKWVQNWMADRLLWVSGRYEKCPATTVTESKRLFIFGLEHVLIEPTIGKVYREDLDDWHWMPNRLCVIERLKQDGRFVTCTANRGGVAFGIGTVEEEEAQMKRIAFLSGLDDYRVCYAHERAETAQFRRGLDRRKPNPGMLEELLASYSIEPAEALVVGEYAEDMQAAYALGIAFVRADIFFGR